MFKKGGKSKTHKSLQPLTPEGEKLSRPISPNITGRLREAVEIIAHSLENDLHNDNNILLLMSSGRDKNGGIEQMDTSMVRASIEQLGDMMMASTRQNDEMAQTIVTIANALMHNDKKLRDYNERLNQHVASEIKKGNIEDPDAGTSKKRSSSKGSLNFDSIEEFGEKMKGISIDDLSDASDQDIDDLINRLTKESGLENDE